MERKANSLGIECLRSAAKFVFSIVNALMCINSGYLSDESSTHGVLIVLKWPSSNKMYPVK